MSALLQVNNLCVDYLTDYGDVRAVDNVSFSIQPGEVFGLAGESGCGKSTIAYSLMRLHKPPAYIAEGDVIFEGTDLLSLSERQLNEFRWQRVSMVFQSAMNALNPVLTLEEQFCDVLKAHSSMSRHQAKQRAAELMEMVDIHPDRLHDYPHQFSGGMRQRLVIAIALALNPRLLIMDEPTTALDVVIQREILQKIHQLKETLGFSILFITHDLSLMVEFADRIGVMYAGELIELAPASDIMRSPLHPYTRGLANSFPPLNGPKTPLTGIPGHPLDLTAIPQGCRFQDRCDFAGPACRAHPLSLEEVHYERWSRCLNWHQQQELNQMKDARAKEEMLCQP